MFGHVGVSFRDQGSNMVLNIFWGPVLNAAAGLAITVQSVVYQFAGNMVTAISTLFEGNHALVDGGGIYACEPADVHSSGTISLRKGNASLSKFCNVGNNFITIINRVTAL